MSKAKKEKIPTLDYLYQEFVTKYHTWSKRQAKESYGITTTLCRPEIVDRLAQVRATEWAEYVHARDLYELAAHTGQFPRIN